MVNLLSNYAIDSFLPIAKWLVLGVFVLVLLAWLVVFLAKKENFSSFVKTSLVVLFIFLLAIGLVGLILEITKSFDPAYVEENGLDRQSVTTLILIPVTCLLLSLMFTVIGVTVVTKKSVQEHAKTNSRKVITIFGLVDLVVLIAVGICMALYFERNKEWHPNLNQTILYISSALIIITIVALAFILDKGSKPFDTKCLSLAGVTVAMSFGLSYIKIFEMPQGGSITLFSLLPIMIFSFAYGTKKGVFVCFIYGVLQAIQDPWLIHPAQFLLDYPVAFSAIGLSGAFAKLTRLEKFPQVSFLLGAIPAVTLRFLSHVFSGVFAFASTYAGDLDSWLYSLGYNSFVFIDMAIVLVVGAIVFSSKAFNKELNKLSNNL